MKELFFEEAVTTAKASLTVKLDVGQLRVQTHDKPVILVEARVKKATVEVSRKGEDVTVIARTKRGSNWLALLGSNARSELTITVPPECRLYLKTATGSMLVEDVLAPVTVKTATGSVQLRNLGGAIEATVVTGKLAYVGALSADSHLFKVVTGSIYLGLTHQPDATLSAHTTTGSIRCQYPLQNQKRERQFISESLRGQLGQGTGSLKMTAVTGSITIADKRQAEDEAPAVKDDLRITKEEVYTT
jgi:DUF4097 and DUF4098 domain-containing protein YvlB